MKVLLVFGILFGSIAVPCSAQENCPAGAVKQTAVQALMIQSELQQIRVADMEDAVPPAVAEKIAKLKDALARLTAESLMCEESSIAEPQLQDSLAKALHANAHEADQDAYTPKDDELITPYGRDLRIEVRRPSNAPDILAFQYSMNIECGTDTMLLLYGFENGHWIQKLRWQAPLLKEISDAFGDFFEVGYLHAPSIDRGKDTLQVIVAHGTSWCTSRFSGFKLDLLSPGKNADVPLVLWHLQRSYSRGDFGPRLTTSGNTFDLRLNADCMMFDSDNCFERRVIYRYKVEDDNSVHRINPIANHALGFVEEWLSAPWSEAREVSDAASASLLQKSHEQLTPSPNKDPYISLHAGAVRACTTTGVFQIQIDSTLEKIVPGKPGGESQPLSSVYFHVREIKNGYLMLSAPTHPDPACNGRNLMSSSK